MVAVPSSSDGNLKFGSLDRTVATRGVIYFLEGTIVELISTIERLESVVALGHHLETLDLVS
jgi:hypothetical protein